MIYRREAETQGQNIDKIIRIQNGFFTRFLIQ
jgi:hypothetical protein